MVVGVGPGDRYWRRDWRRDLVHLGTLWYSGVPGPVIPFWTEVTRNITNQQPYNLAGLVDDLSRAGNWIDFDSV